MRRFCIRTSLSTPQDCQEIIFLGRKYNLTVVTALDNVVGIIGYNDASSSWHGEYNK